MQRRRHDPDRIVRLVGDDLAKAPDPARPNCAPQGGDHRRRRLVGISRGGHRPDAEIFTKAPPMASVGTGQDAGSFTRPRPGTIRSRRSSWSYPRRRIVGAMLERRQPARRRGRWALLLGKAKDNNASAAIWVRSWRLLDRPSRSKPYPSHGGPSSTVEGETGSGCRAAPHRADQPESRRPVSQMIRPQSPISGRRRPRPWNDVAPVEDRDAPGKGSTDSWNSRRDIGARSSAPSSNRMVRTTRRRPGRTARAISMRNLAEETSSRGGSADGPSLRRGRASARADYDEDHSRRERSEHERRAGALAAWFSGWASGRQLIRRRPERPVRGGARCEKPGSAQERRWRLRRGLFPR